MDITLAGVGVPAGLVAISGTRCTGSCPLMTSGEVVPGRGAGVTVAKEVADILRSARFNSRLGGSREGGTSAVVVSCGGGGMIFLIGLSAGDHNSAAGIGISCGSTISGGRSGCTSVWG